MSEGKFDVIFISERLNTWLEKISDFLSWICVGDKILEGIWFDEDRFIV